MLAAHFVGVKNFGPSLFSDPPSKTSAVERALHVSGPDAPSQHKIMSRTKGFTKPIFSPEFGGFLWKVRGVWVKPWLPNKARKLARFCAAREEGNLEGLKLTRGP